MIMTFYLAASVIHLSRNLARLLPNPLFYCPLCLVGAYETVQWEVRPYDGKSSLYYHKTKLILEKQIFVWRYLTMRCTKYRIPLSCVQTL